jgi:hypothetical protein
MMIGAERIRSVAEASPGHADRLEELAAVLAAAGLRTRLLAPAGRLPRLHVLNPAAPALAEDVYVGPGPDGVWWYWWSWAERVACADDLAGAAELISRVLAARD